MALSKNITVISDAQIDADSPGDVTLFTAIRDTLVALYEAMGYGTYTLDINHDHDGTNSAPTKGSLKSSGTDFSANGSNSAGAITAITISSIEVPASGTLIVHAAIDAYNSYTGSGAVTSVVLKHGATTLHTWSNNADAGKSSVPTYVSFSVQSTTAQTADITLVVNGAASPYTIGYYDARVTYQVYN